MKERFEGPAGKPKLVDALQNQFLFKDGAQAVNEAVDLFELIEVAPNEKLIAEDASDIDLYFILSGKFSIMIKGNLVASRTVGDSVGEMSAIEHSLPRAADVIAEEASLVAQLSSDRFHGILDRYPHLWKNLTKPWNISIDFSQRMHKGWRGRTRSGAC